MLRLVPGLMRAGCIGLIGSLFLVACGSSNGENGDTSGPDQDASIGDDQMDANGGRDAAIDRPEDTGAGRGNGSEGGVADALASDSMTTSSDAESGVPDAARPDADGGFEETDDTGPLPDGSSTRLSARTSFR